MEGLGSKQNLLAQMPKLGCEASREMSTEQKCWICHRTLEESINEMKKHKIEPGPHPRAVWEMKQIRFNDADGETAVCEVCLRIILMLSTDGTFEFEIGYHPSQGI